VLAERGRSWLRIHIAGNEDDGLAAIGRLVTAASLEKRKALLCASE